MHRTLLRETAPAFWGSELVGDKRKEPRGGESVGHAQEKKHRAEALKRAGLRGIKTSQTPPVPLPAVLSPPYQRIFEHNMAGPN